MSDLANKLRNARRLEIKVGEIIFSGSRATPEQFSRYVNQQATDAEVCRIHIDDWQGMKECDIFPGSSKDLIKFDRDTWFESIGEHPEWYQPLVEKIIEKAKERIMERAKNEKK